MPSTDRLILSIVFRLRVEGNQIKLKAIIREDNLQYNDDSLYTETLYQSRVNLFNLLNEAKLALSDIEFEKIKKTSIDFMCDSFGCSIDADALHKYGEEIFTEAEFVYIIENSALNRWF